MNPTGISRLWPSFAHTVALALRRSSWTNPVRSRRSLAVPRLSCSLSFPVKAMVEVFRARYVSLHVRVTNRAAFSLYHETLGFSYGATGACSDFFLGALTPIKTIGST